MQQEILKVTNAVKYFGNGSVVTRALDGISFAVNKGEFVAVMSASGSDSGGRHCAFAA